MAVVSQERFYCTHSLDIQQASTAQHSDKRFYKLRLGNRIHPFADNFMYTIAGTFSQQGHGHESQQDRNEAIVGDECNVDPGDVASYDFQTEAGQLWIAGFIRSLDQEGEEIHYGLNRAEVQSIHTV